jgi:hypothetical protein
MRAFMLAGRALSIRSGSILFRNVKIEPDEKGPKFECAQDRSSQLAISPKTRTETSARFENPGCFTITLMRVS